MRTPTRHLAITAPAVTLISLSIIVAPIAGGLGGAYILAAWVGLAVFARAQGSRWRRGVARRKRQPAGAPELAPSYS
jgi:hypothetical protein